MRKYKHILSLLFCLLTGIPAAFAQPLIKCTEYKSGGEMDHTRVACYEQDSKGLIWFGTWIGLCRYDGKEFHFFRDANSQNTDVKQVPLGSNRIMKMVLDSHENLWCQNYDNGLYRFDRKTSTYQSVLPLVKEYPASLIIKDKAYALTRNHVVWVSLADGTLVRFNDSDPSVNEILPCSATRKNRNLFEVFEDSQAREWVLTDEGIYLYGKGWVSTYPYSRVVEENGRIFFSANMPAQMAEFCADGQFRNIALPSKINKIRYFLGMGDGIVSVSADAGLALFDAKTDSCHFYDETVQGNKFHHVGRAFRDSKKRVWFFTDGTTLYCIRPGAQKADCLPNPDKPITTPNEGGRLHMIIEDGNGVIWAKPVDGILCYVNESDFRLHSSTECLPDGQTLPIHDYNFYFVDVQKNLWVSSGTKLYELSFGRRQFHPIYSKSRAEVRSLLADDVNHVLAGDKDGCLSRYDFSTGDWQYLTAAGQWSSSPCVFNPNGIYCLYRDHSRNIWVGTRGMGLYKLTPESKSQPLTRYSVTHYCNQGGQYDLNCNNIYDIYEDENNRLWIATFGGGLNLLENQEGELTRFIHAGNELLGFPVKKFEVVRTICGDGRGHLLAGTNKGILAFSSKFNNYSELNFHLYQAQDSVEHPLQDNMVMQILCDTTGSFYVSTYGRGLCRVEGSNFDSLSFKPIRNREFPAGDTNISALMQRDCSVWTVAECGITCYSPKVDRMWYFDERDFDQYYYLSECAPIEMPDKKIVMGMFGGLFVFQSNDLHKSLYAPKIVFTQVTYAEGSTEHQLSVNDIDTLEVLPNQRSTSIHFAALDYVPSRLIRYAYWMQSSDDNEENPHWVYTTTPEVNFTNLAPGEYKLHIHSTNNEGIWRNNFRVLTIVVLPTFWEKWGLLIDILLILVAASVSLTWYLRHLKQRQQEVVKQEVAATKIEMLARPAEQNDQEFVRQLMAIINMHLADGELQVANLADEMNMSRATFYRRLKQTVDMSPNDFVHQVRMRRSTEMLSNTEDTVAEIAYAVGFNNPKYFSKCFRQEYGVTPAEYRTNSQKKKEESDDQDTIDSGND